jgi:hypothetical protein
MGPPSSSWLGALCAAGGALTLLSACRCSPRAAKVKDASAAVAEVAEVLEYSRKLAK